jgi:carbon monoxide dehydrogenase subunit G
MARTALTTGRCLSDKQHMPKIATKFTADVVLKVGRQSMTVKVPVDLADVSGDDVVAFVTKSATDRLGDSLTMTIANASALKKAHKAYAKAHS